MIEVTLLPHPYLREKVQLFVDDELWREMPSNLLKNSPFLGTFPSFAPWALEWRAWELKIAKQVSLNQLSIKRYFASELKKKLESYGFAADVIEELLKELGRLQLLDDEEGIESFIRKAIRQKKGPLWISSELKRKGVLIDLKEPVERLYPLEMRQECIRAFLKKSKKEKQKAIRALLGRGFFLEEVLQVYSSIDI